ncbi:MAG TPA: hypothetical protein VFB58_00280 [Chloroflexota bacterium]|nr:hypothetical protein [Chloroflexota bacterium]
MRTTRFFCRPLAALLIGAAWLVPAAAGIVNAAGATGLPVSLRPSDAAGNLLPGPGYFRFTAAAGTTTQLYALVGNPSHRTGEIRIVPVDAATGVYGGVTARLASQPRRHAGRWIHLAMTRVTLHPDRGEVVPFTVTVPASARPGQYVAALTAFTPSQDTARGRDFAVTVQTRLADFVVITVPGAEHRAFRLRGLSVQRRTASTYVIAYIHNSGTMMLHGWGYLWVWGPRHKNPILSRALAIGTTLPHSTAQYPIELGAHPLRGVYSYHLKVWWRGGMVTRHAAFRVS